jgi:Domain of unknown function (DUF1937).
MNFDDIEIPKGLVYLSIPYSDKSKLVVRRRMEVFNQITLKLLSMGVHVVSPMLVEHLLTDTDIEITYDRWSEYCETMMNSCDELWVIQVEGWDKSTGVKAEIEYAKKTKKAVAFLEVASG